MRDGFDFEGPWSGVVPGSVIVCVESGEERGSRGSADGIGAVGIREAEALRCE